MFFYPLYPLNPIIKLAKLQFQEIIDTNSFFVAQLQDNVVFNTIEYRLLTDDDKKAGVQRDMVVRLGSKKKQNILTQPVRVIEILHKDNIARPRKSKVSSKKLQNHRI